MESNFTSRVEHLSNFFVTLFWHACITFLHAGIKSNAECAAFAWASAYNRIQYLSAAYEVPKGEYERKQKA
jgi:hypothetical protein